MLWWERAAWRPRPCRPGDETVSKYINPEKPNPTVVFTSTTSNQTPTMSTKEDYEAQLGRTGHTGVADSLRETKSNAEATEVLEAHGLRRG